MARQGGVLFSSVFLFVVSYITSFNDVSAAGGLVGGLNVANTEDENVQHAANFAVSEINMMRNSMYNLKLVDVIQAKTQVVNGALYHLTLDVGTTGCRKVGRNDNLDGCSVNKNKIERCEVKVTESPEPNHHFSMSPSFSCKHKKSKTLVGGAEKKSSDDRVSQAIAQFAIQQMELKSNSSGHKNVLVKLISAQRQTVAGELYKLQFIMSQSECDRDGQVTTLDQCPALDGGKTWKCSVSVMIQLWMRPTHTVEESECEEVRGKGTGSHHVRDKRNAPVIINMGGQDPPSAAAAAEHHDQQPPSPHNKILLGADGHDIGNFGAFREFTNKYNKTYKSEKEMKYRFKIFRDNMKKVMLLNKAEQGPKDVRARYGATVFADLTESEFRQFYLNGGKMWDLDKRPERQAPTPLLPAGEGLPQGFDWREHGAVTEVKNQGMCGSCWAFSTTGNIEGQWYLRKKKLLSLSEQELVDCDKIDEGCNGGLPTQAYDAIIKLGGLETEGQYPYEGRREKCAFSQNKAPVYINDSLAISKNETEMAMWLLQNGPISIGINANAMMFYLGGVSHPWRALCRPDSLDHGVLIVGFGTAKSWLTGRHVPYWLIKNSWGTWWGERGYYRIYRGDGACGVNQMCTTAVVQ